jgi:hypothetical protein
MHIDYTDRYIIFGIHSYYPSGGMNDVVATVSSKDEAHGILDKYLRDGLADHGHIFDSVSGEII